MLFISHRGYIKKYTENSLEGIKYAFNVKEIDGVEFDIRITKDKKIVLLHDFFIDRVSNGTGIVNKLTYKELLKYNFGNKRITKIAKLEDVLKINTNKIFIIDIKFDYNEYLLVKRKFLNLIKKYSYKKIYLCSFNKRIINDLKNNNLNIKLGYIMFKNKKIYDVDFVLVKHTFYKETSNNTFIWTVNSKNDIIFNDDNIKGLISDYPIKLRKEYNEHF